MPERTARTEHSTRMRCCSTNELHSSPNEGSFSVAPYLSPTPLHPTHYAEMGKRTKKYNRYDGVYSIAEWLHWSGLTEGSAVRLALKRSERRGA